MESVMVWVQNVPNGFMCLNPSFPAGGTVWKGHEGFKRHHVDKGIGSLDAGIEDLWFSTVSCPISLLPLLLRCKVESGISPRLPRPNGLHPTDCRAK